MAKGAETGEAGSAAQTAGAKVPQRAPTMMDVAFAAGVSQTTVSLVLNDVSTGRFSADTRHRVQEAAKRLDYRPTRRQSRAQSGQGTIAFVVDEMSTDPWMALAMDGIRDTAWTRGLTVIAAATRGNGDAEQSLLRQLAAEPTVGLIYGTINTRRVEAPALGRPVPLVLLNCFVADHALPSVLPAEVVGGMIATRRLVAAGHSRIGYITGEPWMDASRDRLKGYRRALAEADIPFEAELVRPGNWEPSAGYEQTRLLMALPRPPTAIFCGNDLMALGCYEALKAMGRAIPSDVAVIGYDDREIAGQMHPPLTSVLLPHYEMGVEAAELLLDLAAGSVARSVKVEGRLVERQSV